MYCHFHWYKICLYKKIGGVNKMILEEGKVYNNSQLAEWF
jgi:hypothetical protein